MKHIVSAFGTLLVLLINIGICIGAVTVGSQVAAAKEYEAQGRALIVAPDDICGLKTLSKDKDSLERFYQKGLRDAQTIPAFISEH